MAKDDEKPPKPEPKERVCTGCGGSGRIFIHHRYETCVMCGGSGVRVW